MAHFADKINTLGVPRVYQWKWNSNKGGGIDTPISHVMDRLEKMVGGARLQTTVSESSEMDRVGCIAVAKDGGLDLMIFRHLAVRDNGKRVPLRLQLQGTLMSSKDWSIKEASVIDGDHPGFMHAQVEDLEKAGKAGKKEVIRKNRAKYEKMSKLSEMPPPVLAKDASGLHLDLELDGHSVILLRLEPSN